MKRGSSIYNIVLPTLVFIAGVIGLCIAPPQPFIDNVISFIFFTGLATFLIVCGFSFFSCSQTRLSDTDAFGAKLLINKVYDGLKVSLLATFAWAVLLFNTESPSQSSYSVLVKVLGEKNSLEFLALIIFLLATLTIQGMNYGISQDLKNDKLKSADSNTMIKCLLGLLSLIIFLVSILHMFKLYII